VRVGAARHSVAEAHRAEDVGANMNGNNESRSTGETPMEISDAAARRRPRVALRQNVGANQGTSSTHDLRDGALQVRAADAVNPLERAHQSIAVKVGVCRCDADHCPPGHDEHDTGVSQRWNALPDDVPNRPSCASRRGGRNRRSRSNPLVHD
jgi:hypothetical protein